MSLLSAFRGDTYTTRVSSGSDPASASRTNSSMAHRNAARVLPEPVGAAMSVWLAALMAGHASRCAADGAVKVLWNHPATAG